MPRIIDHDRYRFELLERCGELFSEHGYAALSIRQIAQHLGVSTGTLYHYFSSKEELFRQLAGQVAEADIDELTRLFEAHPALEARFDAFLSWIVDREPYCLAQYLVSCDYARAIGLEQFKADATIREATERYRTTVASALELDPRVFTFVDNFLGGLLINRFLDGGNTPLADQLAMLKAMLVSYGALRPSSDACPAPPAAAPAPEALT